MKSNLLMNFTVDKENNTVNVKREFNASLPQVWSAWTEPQILDLWWAPAPWKSKTKSMDFKEGGRRLYAMLGLKAKNIGPLQILLQLVRKLILNI